MTKPLSPEAQVVLDALNEQIYELNSQHMAAAVATLRAAAPLMEFVQDHQKLCSIAEELEAC